MLLWVNSPFVFSLFLLSWRKITMSFSVHISNDLVLVCTTTDRVEDIFSVLKSLSWNSECSSTVLGLAWPFIFARISLTKRFAYMRGILVFFDIIELVSQTLQVLSSYVFGNTLWRIGWLSIGVRRWVIWRIICSTPMLLNFAWLINMWLSVFFKMWWSRWLVAFVHALPDTEISTLYNTLNWIISTSSNARNWVWLHL